MYSLVLVRRILPRRLKHSVRHKDPCDHRNVPQNVVPDKGQLDRVDPENCTPHACQDDRHGVFKFSGALDSAFQVGSRNCEIVIV